jgi:very-short-patch-repair endonuclease
MRDKASSAVKELWKDTEYVHRILANKKSVFTSKGEVEIREYFMSNFPNDGWTFGGCLRQDGIGIVRDLYSSKLKTCIEYDGIWHFKDIHGQLQRKKYKDSLLEQWCVENNWRLIRIDEDEYLKHKKNSIELLVDLAYHGRDIITRIGNRYDIPRLTV